MGAIFNLTPSMGSYALMKGIAVIILGGMGSLAGVVVGGLVLGFIDGIVPPATECPIGEPYRISVHHPCSDIQTSRYYGEPELMNRRKAIAWRVAQLWLYSSFWYRYLSPGSTSFTCSS